jgi:hypothetical protein
MIQRREAGGGSALAGFSCSATMRALDFQIGNVASADRGGCHYPEI